MDTIETMTRIDSGAFDEAFGYLYSEKAQEQRARYKNAALQFETLFGAAVRSACSAPRDAPRWRESHGSSARACSGGGRQPRCDCGGV